MVIALPGVGKSGKGWGDGLGGSRPSAGAACPVRSAAAPGAVRLPAALLPAAAASAILQHPLCVTGAVVKPVRLAERSTLRMGIPSKGRMAEDTIQLLKVRSRGTAAHPFRRLPAARWGPFVSREWNHRLPSNCEHCPHAHAHTHRRTWRSLRQHSPAAMGLSLNRGPSAWLHNYAATTDIPC